MTADAIIDEILVREGGYVDHPSDRGNCTNHGITLDTLIVWRGGSVTCQDVQTLTVEEARRIYKALYIERPRLDRVADDRLRALLIDYAVHSGAQRAIRALQVAVGVRPDGIIGPQTEAALEQADPAFVYRSVLRDRIGLIATILQREPSQRAFAAGWVRRLAEFI
jgi:lysozyme family protein